MRIAVAGDIGLVGRRLIEVLRSGGYETVVLARGQGVDLVACDGLDAALAGVDAVVHVTNTPDTNPAQAERFFGTVAGTPLAAEQQAGVAHHVVLSIVGLDRVAGNGHYDGKQRQENVVQDGSVPWTIQRAAQFFDFPAMVSGSTTQDGMAVVPPLLVRPIATADVAAVLAEHATGAPGGRAPDLAGPDTHDLVDVARRTLAVREDPTRLRASWRGGAFGVEMGGEVLLPDESARLGSTTFESWLAAGAPS